MTDAKKRAQDGLAELVEDAIKTLGQSVRGQMMMVRGSTRTSDARFVLSAVLEMQQLDQGAGASSASTMSADELAAKREQLRLARLAERKQA